MSDTVSVIVAAFNMAETLPRALESALSQTWPVHEIIVVDDGSHDGTLDVANRFARRHRNVHVLQGLVNHGPGYARNVAIDASSGNWIALLDADDRWSPDRLQTLIPLANEAGADLQADNLFLVHPR